MTVLTNEARVEMSIDEATEQKIMYAAVPDGFGFWYQGNLQGISSEAPSIAEKIGSRFK